MTHLGSHHAVIVRLLQSVMFEQQESRSVTVLSVSCVRTPSTAHHVTNASQPIIPQRLQHINNQSQVLFLCVCVCHFSFFSLHVLCVGGRQLGSPVGNTGGWFVGGWGSHVGSAVWLEVCQQCSRGWDPHHNENRILVASVLYVWCGQRCGQRAFHSAKFWTHKFWSETDRKRNGEGQRKREREGNKPQ